jgi:hypothetical protein
VLIKTHNQEIASETDNRHQHLKMTAACALSPPSEPRNA